MQYSTINVTADWISPYGQCYSRNASNVIVMLGSEESACYRCFNLKMVSKNIILLIHNEIDINSKCSSSAETVKCPNEINFNDDEIFQSDFHSIILYRKFVHSCLKVLKFLCPDSQAQLIEMARGEMSSARSISSMVTSNLITT